MDIEYDEIRDARSDMCDMRNQSLFSCQNQMCFSYYPLDILLLILLVSVSVNSLVFAMHIFVCCGCKFSILLLQEKEGCCICPYLPILVTLGYQTCAK